jgi:hypothetical protein
MPQRRNFPEYGAKLYLDQVLPRTRSKYRSMRAHRTGQEPPFATLPPRPGRGHIPTGAHRARDPRAPAHSCPLFEAVRTFLHRLSEERPLLLLLDDLH